ncbi:MAG: hypothetical protein ACQEQ4_03650 [Fibrobacterota bacterium]
MLNKPKAYIQAERECINREKWRQGEMQHCDPGESYVLEWIKKNSESFRRAWIEYNCDTCDKKMNCPTNFHGCVRKKHS